MKDCAGFACHNTRERGPVQDRFTVAARIFQVFILVGSDHDHGRVPKGVIGIFINNQENLCRTCRNTIAAAIAPIRVNGNEKIT